MNNAFQQLSPVYNVHIYQAIHIQDARQRAKMNC